MVPVKELHQPLFDVKYRLSLGDLVELHVAVLAYADLEAANQPKTPNMPKPRRGL
jgi:hypothetical protein